MGERNVAQPALEVSRGVSGTLGNGARAPELLGPGEAVRRENQIYSSTERGVVDPERAAFARRGSQPERAGSHASQTMCSCNVAATDPKSAMEQSCTTDRIQLDLSISLDLRAFLRRAGRWVIPLLLLLGSSINCSRSTTSIHIEGDGNVIEVVAEPISSSLDLGSGGPR